MTSINQYQKVVPFILFVLALVLFFNLVKTMITLVISSILLAYISFPLYTKIKKRIPNESFSAILTILIAFVTILIPFAFLAFGVTQQAYYFYESLSEGVEKGALFGFGCDSANSEVCLLVNQAEKFSLEKLSTFGFDEQVKKFLPILQEKLTLLILSIPILIGKVFIALVISYFILIQWKSILKTVTNLLPMRKKTIKRLIKEFGNITHTVIYAQLFVALVQGIVATIGFYIFGAPFPMLLGIITAFFALIPAVGTALIWVPASLFLILSGYFTNNYFILWKGVGLFLYCALIVSTIDNILLAKIVHKKAKINQISVIVGVIGGAAMFGIMGIFIGPILLPLLVTYFQTFKERFA